MKQNNNAIDHEFTTFIENILEPKITKIIDAISAHKKYFIIAWGIAFLIIAIGTYLSIECNDWRILARAGALLVVVALFLEGVGIIKFYSDKIVNFINNLIKEDITLSSNGLTKEEKVKEIERRQKLAKDVILNKFKKTEFYIATLGTLLWGFADLLGVK
jgi:glucan phosphoethanolaminetransferase (alkaline phosphatase superfamily)